MVALEHTQNQRIHWAKKYKKHILFGIGGLLLLAVAAQFLYPADRLLPHARVDGLAIGGWQKKDAIWELDRQYAAQQIDVYVGENDTKLVSAKPAEIGLTITNEERISQHGYPWYMRLIPSSMFWYEKINQPFATPKSTHDQAKAKMYVDTHIGKACNVKPVNAKVKPEKDGLAVVSAQQGGTCKSEDVVGLLLDIQPKQLVTQTARIPVKPIAAKIDDDTAKKFATAINEQIEKGVTIKAGGASAAFDKNTLISWLEITTKNDKLQVTVSTKKSQAALQKHLGDKVYAAAGITKVTTQDFTEVKRINGGKGRQLDIQATVNNLTKFVQGKNENPTAVVRVVQPEVHYTRTYSKSNAGISAQMQHYAKDNKGDYGVQMIEIGGKGRRAGYNASKQFTTASTYKLFVAYSTLKKVEAGKFKWSQQITGGRNLTTCFDDMIVKSDNPCAEALIDKISHSTLQSDANSLGLTGTTFSHPIMNGSYYATTANDLATFLAALYTGSMPLKTENRNKLIDAMKRNIYRQGIPSGVNATVADKVGFLADILNDAAIVYSPKGTYVLVIMTEGSSWGNIAELTRKIEKLR